MNWNFKFFLENYGEEILSILLTTLSPKASLMVWLLTYLEKHWWLPESNIRHDWDIIQLPKVQQLVSSVIKRREDDTQ